MRSLRQDVWCVCLCTLVSTAYVSTIFLTDHFQYCLVLSQASLHKKFEL